MPVQKGHTNNPKGRPPGIPSRKTLEWAALNEAIITRHATRFNNVLDGLEDEKFVDKYLQVLEYFKPKLQRSEVQSESRNINMDLDGMTDDELMKKAKLLAETALK